MPPQLLLFDIDGTLTRSAGTFDGLFAAAIEAELAVRMHQRWSEYTHSTDSGILTQVLMRARCRPPTESEVERVQRRYHEELDRQAHRVEAILGAEPLLASLRSRAQPRAAIVTGNWRQAGRIKLRGAGLSDTGLRIFSACDAVDRREILGLALEAHQARAEDAVYIGDAPWDARAAQALGLPFVGVIHQQDRFDNFDQVQKLSDYAQPQRFWEALERARVPVERSP